MHFYYTRTRGTHLHKFKIPSIFFIFSLYVRKPKSEYSRNEYMLLCSYMCLLFAPKEPQLCGGDECGRFYYTHIECMRSHNMFLYCKYVPSVLTHSFKDIHQRKWIESVVWIALESALYTPTHTHTMFPHSYIIYTQTNKYITLPPRSPIQIFLELSATYSRAFRISFVLSHIIHRRPIGISHIYTYV